MLSKVLKKRRLPIFAVRTGALTRNYMTREPPKIGDPALVGVNAAPAGKLLRAKVFEDYSPLNTLGSVDHNFEVDRIKRYVGEENTRDFTYFLLGGARLAYLSITRLTLIKVSNATLIYKAILTCTNLFFNSL